MSIYEPEPNEFLMEDYGMTQSPNKVIERDFINAKAYMLTTSERSGLNLYDHLANVLTKILDERPRNLKEVFEEYCNREKRRYFDYKLDTLLSKKSKSKGIKLAIAQKKQFKEVMKMNEDSKYQENTLVPNLRYISFLLDQADLGIGREETIRAWVAIKVLSKKIPKAVKVRFWGKIFGRMHNYVIAEVEFEKDATADDGEFMDELEEDRASLSTVNGGLPHGAILHEPAELKGEVYFLNEAAEQINEQILEMSVGQSGDGFDIQELVKKVKNEPVPPLPQPFHLKPPSVTREKPRSGINKKAYYVCSNPGDPWIKLPAVTPQQISVARKIKKFFTGILDAPVVSYPPFPGTEKNYLRAQIARISSGTHISPAGYFQLEEEEEEEEGEEADKESGARGNLLENPEFEPLTVAELANPDLGNWVHHVQYILEQGRTKWWDPTEALMDIKRQIREHNKLIKKQILEEDGNYEEEGEEEEEENEDEDEEEELDEPLEPEEGPPLLTPISEDQGPEGMPSWTARLSSKYAPESACAVLESNTWPGACAIGNANIFENIYVGWGQKFTVESYQPASPFDLQTEFISSDSELMEINDPTPSQEDAWIKANMPQEDEEEDEDEEDDSEEEDDREDADTDMVSDRTDVEA